YFVVDKMGRIQKLDRELHVRALVRTPEIARGKPTGLFVTPSGEPWVCATHYSRVLVSYTAGLELKRSCGAPGDAAGRFLLLRDAKLRGDGPILTVDYGDLTARVQTWAKEGEAVASFGRFGAKAAEFQRPQRVAVCLEHRELFVTDAANHRIQVLDFDGKFRREIGGIGTDPGSMKYPYDVVLDEAG